MVTNVLVTGGTGALGTELVPLLVTVGLHVRVLSRRRAPAVPAGAQAVRGDLTTGDGLDEAVTAIDVIAHLASETSGIPSYAKAQRTDVEGTGRLLDSARRAGVEPHIVYISIVGVDKSTYPYHRTKLKAEAIMRQDLVPWSILRATQFHNLMETLLGGFTRLPGVTAIPFAWRFQPVEAQEVARRVVDVVLRDPAGMLPDFGGPEVRDFKGIAESWLEARRLPARLVSLAGETTVAAGWPEDAA